MSVARLTQSLILGLLVGFVQIGHAAPPENLVKNGSFESPGGVNAPEFSPGSSGLPNWTIVSNQVTYICEGCFGIVASDLKSSIDLTGNDDRPPHGTIEQIIKTDPTAIYSISFDVGTLSGTSAIEVSVGGNLLGTGSSTASSLKWTGFSGEFTALSGNTTISFTGTQGGTFIGLDNVRVELIQAANAVPEPESYAMLGAGLAMVGWVVRRRRGKVAAGHQPG